MKLYITATIATSFTFFKGQPRLWKKEFEVCALSADKVTLEDFAKDEGIDYHYIPMQREISLWIDLICLLRFIWLFIKERPYIVHGNTPKASLLSMVAGYLTRRPIRIYMCHGLRYQTTKGLLRHTLMAMERLSCHCATNVYCVSNSVMEQLIADGICSQQKAKVIGCGTAGGIDTEYFKRDNLDKSRDIRSELGIEKDAFVFCFVGRIVADKGINELVEATKRLVVKYKNVYLLLIGSEETGLTPISFNSKEIIKSNLHIFALGWQNDVRPFIAASDAFVLPSYREGVGMVILEANALGVPGIASDIIGCRDVIEPNVNGVLVQSHDSDALYTVMKDWVEHPEMVKAMSKKCRQFVMARYLDVDVRNAYFEEYKRLAGL